MRWSSYVDRLAVAPLGAGAAVVLDVALGAHHAGIGFFHHADLAETVTEGDYLQVGLAVLGEDVVLGVALDRLDQAVTHDAGLGAVRIVAVDAADRIVGVLGDIDDVGGAVPLGLGILVPHELPLQDVVGGLALDAGRIAGHGGFLQLVILPLVLQHVPGLAGFINTFPAVLELEAPTLETIHGKLVDDHEGVTTRLVVFKGEAVGCQQFVLHGRAAGRRTLFLAGAAVVIYLEEAFILALVALAAQRLVDERDRLVLLRVLHVGVQLVVADRTGQLGMFGALFERLDLVVALVTFGAPVVDQLGGRLVDGGGQGGDRQYGNRSDDGRSKGQILLQHGDSPFRGGSSAWSADGAGMVRACILIALGVTGHTYSQAPQPLQCCGLIRTPTPGMSFMAPGSHRSIQAKQPLFLARQLSLQATAVSSSCGAETNSAVSATVMTGPVGFFKALLIVQTASPSEKRLFLKKSLRLMFINLYPFSPGYPP